MIRKLPALPIVAQRIIALDMQNEADQLLLAPAICQCPVTSARIIALANSAAVSIRYPVTSVKDAITLIGLRKAHVMAYAIAMYSLSRRQTSALNYQQLWQHNTQCMQVMQALANTMDSQKRPTDSEIALTALLHDIGFVIFDVIDPKNSDHFHQQSGGFDYQRVLEKQLFSTSHAAIGAEVLMAWGVPDTITTAIRLHHHYSSPHIPVLAQLLRFTEMLCNAQIDWQSDKPFSHQPRDYWAFLAITDTRLFEVCTQLVSDGIHINAKILTQ